MLITLKLLAFKILDQGYMSSVLLYTFSNFLTYCRRKAKPMRKIELERSMSTVEVLVLMVYIFRIKFR